MAKKVAIVAPRSLSGGVKTTVSKLAEALGMEGLKVKRVGFPNIIPPNGIQNVPRTGSALFKEMSLFKPLMDFDTVIYMAEIAYLSHLLCFAPKKALVIHGFVRQEWTHWIARSQHLITRAFIKTRLRYWETFNLDPKLNGLDFLVCRSDTSAEVNRIRGDYAIFPNYVLPREIEARKSEYEMNRGREIDPHEVTILSYLSTVESPRLLGRKDMVHLYSLVTKLTSKKVRFILIDPLNPNPAGIESSLFQVLPYVTPEEWVRLMLSADLYLEACTDEELRNGAVEAGLLGTPFAKVTTPHCIRRQDYGEDDAVLAISIPELAAKIAEYCNRLEYLRPQYSQRVHEFVTRNRAWDSIKGPLLRRIT